MLVSRRGSLALTLCACSATAVLAADVQPLPPGYTPSSYKPDPGLAPGMQAKLVSGGKNGEPRVWAIVFRDGDEVMSGLTEWATRNIIKGGYLTAIGAFSEATLAWFDLDKKAYRNIPVDEQVECVSFLGDVGLIGEISTVHVHAAVSLPDGTMKGGHLLRAKASPTLEVFVTETQTELHKEKDERSSLNLFRLGE